MKRFFTFLILATFAALFYVYEEVEAVKIGYEIRKQEETRMLALDRSRALKYNIARLKAPINLERKLEAQRIELESPRQWQTLVIPGGKAKTAQPLRSLMPEAPFFGRFFMGTAQAEAKESAKSR